MNPNCISEGRWRSPFLVSIRKVEDLQFRRRIAVVVALSLRQAVECNAKRNVSKEADYCDEARHVHGNRKRWVGACMPSSLSERGTFRMATSMLSSMQESSTTNRIPIFRGLTGGFLNSAHNDNSVMALKEETLHKSRRETSPVRSCSQPDTSIIEAEQMRRKKISEANKGKVPWNKGRRLPKGINGPRCQADCVCSDAVMDLDYDSKVLLREKWRRQKISQANKGKVPWNKGHQHSEETKQLIRARTAEAMKDPEIREKLKAFGRKHCPETRLKISATLSNRWNLIKKTKQTQESCVEEWKEMIAEMARTGDDGDAIYHLKNYADMMKELRDAWELSLKERQRAPLKVPFSADHKTKISEAIKAKWSDAEYRLHVEEGMHGSLLKRGVTVCKRVKPSYKIKDASQKTKSCTRRKTPERKSDSSQIKPIQDLPRYRNPSTEDRLEKLQQMRASRLHMERRQREANERARILIAEARSAALALEAAALKDENALASLVETRRLLAEAAHSVETVGVRAASSSAQWTG